MQDFQDIQLNYLKKSDYSELANAFEEVYSTLYNATWTKEQIETLISKFADGQVIIRVSGEFAGCALSIIVDYDKYSTNHTYAKVTGNDTFSTHTDDGDMLYGIEIFVRPKFRGLRLGRRLYDYRKELCERLNLKGIAFGGRMPNYHNYSSQLTPKEYIEQVKKRIIHDPVLVFQMSNDFHPSKILKGYLKGDEESNDYALLLEWDNIYYEKEQIEPTADKKTVRLGLVQWQMRLYKDVDDLMQQAEFFIDAVSNYRSDFALFPELFNAPLMAKYNHLSEPDAIRTLAEHTEDLVKRFSELAVSYNINIITGSMPAIINNNLYNVGYLCERNGTISHFEKLHITPDEKRVWGMQGGNKIETFDTDCGKIGILICYDVEFPELSRLLAKQGMDILFVPFLTDTQNGYSRVRNCAKARAIENECYVAIAGSVGNLPKVHNMDIQYAQSAVFTPCDFPFPSDGSKAEATPNTEMILIVDVDLDPLRELNQFGSVRNLKDMRTDLYDVVKR